MGLTDLKVHFLQLPLQMSAGVANTFFIQEMRPGFIFRLHFVIEAILIMCIHLILMELFILLQFIIKQDVILELILVFCKQRVLHYV